MGEFFFFNKKEKKNEKSLFNVTYLKQFSKIEK